LPDPVAARLVACVARYAAVAKRQMARLRAVATRALREAKNRDDVVARIKAKTGVELEIVSGTEEARLVCLGVLRGMPPEARSLLVDIGGGSTEFARAEGEEPVELWSVALGAVRLAEMFDASGAVDRDRLVLMRRFAQRVVAEAVPRKLRGTHKHALGSSGTIRAVVGFAAAPGTAHARPDQLSRAVEELARMSPAQRRKRFDPARADIVTAGAVILEAAAHHLKLEAITAVDGGLKEGLLVDLVRRMDPLAHDPLVTEAVRAAGRRFGFDEPHAVYVTSIALQLFDGLARVHGLDRPARAILEVAAMLHDVGYVVSTTRHHRHSEYLIAHTEVPGLSEHERQLAALVARFHRRSAPKREHPVLAGRPLEEVRLVRKLATLLRLADGCDRSRAHPVTSLDVVVKKDAVLLRLQTKGDVALEAWDVEQDVALFRAVFGRRLSIAFAGGS
jgi:exopolyphosphatase / guanosine-5'-triphosphate,3'-diphosphate pyrophosphatase